MEMRKKKAFFEINFCEDSSSGLSGIAKITFKRMSFEDGQVRSVVVEAENIDGNLSWRKIDFRGSGRISALTIELSDSGEIENMKGAISKGRGGKSTTFLATSNWQRPAAKNLDNVSYGAKGVPSGLEFIRSSLGFSYRDMPTQDNFNPLALVNVCLDPHRIINNENLFLFAKV